MRSRRMHPLFAMTSQQHSASVAPLCSATKAAKKHYQRHRVPWPAPTPSVLAELSELEDRMRCTLAALASFNETERMVLLKQFHFQDAAAQRAGVHAAPGLLSLGQFTAAWHNLSVPVTRRQAQALFYKFGCDAAGLLPYDVFAMQLLSCPARMLALEPEATGPFALGVLCHILAISACAGCHLAARGVQQLSCVRGAPACVSVARYGIKAKYAGLIAGASSLRATGGIKGAGGDYGFKGKLKYRPCRTPVFPPTDWAATSAARSAAKPTAGLRLQFVYGYDGIENTSNNVFFNDEGAIVYYTAAVGIVYEPRTHTQVRLCLCLSPAAHCCCSLVRRGHHRDGAPLCCNHIGALSHHSQRLVLCS